MTKYLILIIIAVGTISFSYLKVNEENNLLYLGVLETQDIDWPKFSRYKPDSTKKIVRVLFYKSDDRWKSMAEKIRDSLIYPDQVNWTIAFDGKSIGNFNSSSTPLRFKDSPWSDSRDSYQQPETNDLPTIGERSEDFSSWAQRENFRPLALVSECNFRDPEKWKPFTPDASTKETLAPFYRKYMAAVLDIDFPERTELAYLKSYKSTLDDQLIHLGVKNYREEEIIVDYSLWFHIDSLGLVKNLNEFIDKDYLGDEFTDDDYSDVTLVDAGDYDNDGRSEILFWTSRYNGDGYVLFSNGFKDMTEYTWSYH